MRRVLNHVENTGQMYRLTSASEFVTVSTIRGDADSRPIENQPHLNSGLWPVYLEEADMRYEPVDRDDPKSEAPGGPRPQPE